VNKTKGNSIAHKVLIRIERKGGDTFWSFRDFGGLDGAAVAMALSRLFRAGTLTRIRRGVYYHPKKTVFGDSKPNPEVATDAILRAANIPAVASGATSYNRLGLTTQMAGTMTRATDRRIRRRSVLDVPLRIKIRSRDSLRHAESTERVFLDSLRDLGRIPDTTPSETLGRLGNLVKNKVVSFDRLARLARHEPPRVRALLGALGETVKKAEPRSVEEKSLNTLRATLHPLSTYNLQGAAGSLETAHRWQLT
jgi:hypothetical protein